MAKTLEPNVADSCRMRDKCADCLLALAGFLWVNAGVTIAPSHVRPVGMGCASLYEPRYSNCSFRPADYVCDRCAEEPVRAELTVPDFFVEPR